MSKSQNKEREIYWGKSYTITVGRDPLGIQRASRATYIHLVPGLTNATKRIRYYGFYCWVIEFFQRNILENETEQQADAFRRFIRRTEYFLSILMMLKDKDITGVSGSNFAYKYIYENVVELMDDSSLIDIAYGADKNGNKPVYFKNSLGAFGQYYIGQMQYLDLIRTDKEYSGIYFTTDFGSELANAYDENLTNGIEPTNIKRIFMNMYSEGLISVKDMKVIINNIDLTKVKQDTKEHSMYLELLYGNDSPRINSSAMFRKNTIKALIKFKEQNPDGVFPLDYYEQNFKYFYTLNESEKGWIYYSICEISNYAHGILLWGVLYELKMRGSIDLSNLLELLIRKIGNEFQKEARNPNETFEGLIQNEDSSPLTLIKKCEDGIKEQKKDHYSLMALGIRTIISLFARHQKDLKSLVEYAENNEISYFYDVFNPYFQFQEKKTESFSSVLRMIFLQNIVQRHIFIALSKLWDNSKNTLKFDYENNQLTFVGMIEPEWSNPRLKSLEQFLIDAHDLNDKKSRLVKVVENYISD